MDDGSIRAAYALICCYVKVLVWPKIPTPFTRASHIEPALSPPCQKFHGLLTMCQLRVREQEFAYLDIRLICSRYSLHPVLVFWVASSHLIIDMFDMQSSLESWSKLYYFLDQCIFCNICDLKGRHEHTAVYARIAKIGRARHVTSIRRIKHVPTDDVWAMMARRGMRSIFRYSFHRAILLRM
jgi:hypothetical protein